MEKNDIVIEEIYEARVLDSGCLSFKARIFLSEEEFRKNESKLVTLIMPENLKNTISVMGRNWSEILADMLEVNELQEKTRETKNKIVDLNSIMNWRD